MKDITIPLPNFLEEQIAEVEVIINGKKRQYNFRIESFPWRADEEDLKKGSQETTVKIKRLQRELENYGKEWELIQIFAPSETAKHIQVLFRQKK